MVSSCTITVNLLSNFKTNYKFLNISETISIVLKYKCAIVIYIGLLLVKITLSTNSPRVGGARDGTPCLSTEVTWDLTSTLG